MWTRSAAQAVAASLEDGLIARFATGADNTRSTAASIRRPRRNRPGVMSIPSRRHGPSGT